ncbi:hypothetical protein CLU83_0494 [Flavobacterium sp. 1]|nr:hypothetical protein CLU83_0494 [Flavobacterium sp. 1]
MLIDKSEIREVHGISDDEKQRIMDFLHGAVYCWCNINKDAWFSARDFLGGDNFLWQGSPLYALYEKQIKLGKNNENRVKDAGKDSGWLLKKVVHTDKRKFETKKEDLIRKYRWNGEKDSD